MDTAGTTPDHLRIVLDSQFGLTVTAGPCVLAGLLVLVALIAIYRLLVGGPRRWRSYEIDEAEFGLGNQKLKLRPNDLDRQIAYKIWVELSTRKIGLQIDLNDDVVFEIYDSWYSFFAVTRELIKDVPVSKFRRKDTEQIVRLSIDVLNSGIRPHLTRWQARFRRWYEAQLAIGENGELHPQDIQKRFPEFEDLENDLLSVNEHLIRYKEKMYQLVSGL